MWGKGQKGRKGLQTAKNQMLELSSLWWCENSFFTYKMDISAYFLQICTASKSGLNI
jgi:hypothetical protein